MCWVRTCSGWCQRNSVKVRDELTLPELSMSEDKAEVVLGRK
jgi:hypothetical protein